MNKSKIILASTSVIFATLNIASAFTFYQKNQSPSQIVNATGKSFPKYYYSKENNLNPYSTFQSVYKNQSGRNNFNVYATPVKDYNGVSQGQISQIVKDPKSVSNPYGVHGNIYSSKSPAVPFDQQRWSNPYSTYQDNYSNESLRNNSKYGLQFKDSAGKLVGTKNINGQDSNSVTGGYGQSPYEEDSIHNFYGGNKVFN